MMLPVCASPSTRISLATAGLFEADDEHSGDEGRSESARGHEEIRPVGLGAGLMRLDVPDVGSSAALPILPQLPSVLKDSYGLMPPRPGPAGPMADPIYKVGANGDLVMCAPQSLARELYTPAPPKMPTQQPSRTGSSPPMQATGPMGPGYVGPVGPSSNLGSRTGSRPPSMCGSIGGPSASRGGSRASSPAPSRPGRGMPTSSTSDAMVLGPKEVAVLAMLQQGLDMLGDHMSSRINRRLDDAHNRVGRLDSKFTSLRAAIRHSLAAEGPAREQRPNLQAQENGGARTRIPLGVAPTNQRQPGQSVAGSKSNVSPEQLPAPGSIAASHPPPQPQQLRRPQHQPDPPPPPPPQQPDYSDTDGSTPAAPAPHQAGRDEVKSTPETELASSCLWGGAVAELNCLDSESGALLARVSVSVAAPWEHVCKAVVRAVSAQAGRGIEELRFADGSGGTIGLVSESSWVLCKALRSLNAAASTTITCVLAAPAPTADKGLGGGMSSWASPVPPRRPDAPPEAAATQSSPHVSFKSSPIICQGRERHLPDEGSWEEGGSPPASGAPEAPVLRKKKISDMKPPPLKARKGGERSGARGKGAGGSSGGGRSKYASRKSYEVVLPAEGAAVAFKKLVYTNRHAEATTFELSCLAHESSSQPPPVALEFQHTQLALAAGEEGKIAVKLVKRAAVTESITAGQRFKIRVLVTALSPQQDVGGTVAVNNMLPDLIELSVVMKD